MATIRRTSTPQVEFVSLGKTPRSLDVATFVKPLDLIILHRDGVSDLTTTIQLLASQFGVLRWYSGIQISLTFPNITHVVHNDTDGSLFFYEALRSDSDVNAPIPNDSSIYWKLVGGGTPKNYTTQDAPYDFMLVNDTTKKGELARYSADFNTINDTSGTTRKLLQLNLTSHTLLSPAINGTFTVTNADGTTTYPNPNNQVDNGCIASFSGTYLNPTNPDTTVYKNPTSVTGSWGTTVPPVGSSSSVLNTTGLTATTTYSVNFYSPKEGLKVVGDTVVRASGNDVTGASITLSFFGRGYFGYSSAGTLTQTIVNGFSTQLQGSRALNVNATSGVGNYTYYVYDASFGDLTSIIQDGATPVLGGFTKQSTQSFLNPAGLSVLCNIYKSNATNAFTNANLAIS
jgi:hypothetical protein